MTMIDSNAGSPPARIGQGRAGPGRPRGRRNKFTTDLRTMILRALAAAGGEAYLQQVAETRPDLFVAMIVKLLPSKVVCEDEARSPPRTFEIIFGGGETEESIARDLVPSGSEEPSSEAGRVIPMIR